MLWACVVVVVLLGPLALTTGLGARRRGRAVPACVLAGLGFPVTWIVWYVRDGGVRSAYSRP